MTNFQSGGSKPTLSDAVYAIVNRTGVNTRRKTRHGSIEGRHGGCVVAAHIVLVVVAVAVG